ncbi:MAG: hypothetical protein GF317_02850 [Candidatus Lokiarchaeota archaeon]|nr:hypothetical protein [Candidatus Lokiarchaeota archaeon]MBD3198845.1 hypothetical protein [Candidatus Lokiarchaeota archaeon]
MNVGKLLAIIAGLLTIIGSYIFALYEGLAPNSVASAIGLFQGITLAFESADFYSTSLGGLWIVYLLIILMIIFALSGVFQLIGVKSRAVILIFSLFPLGFGIVVILDMTMTLNIAHIDYMMLLLTEQPLVDGLLPYLLNIGNVGLGTYLIVAGGAIGIVSGMLTRYEPY